MRARLYKPSKTAMQSGKARTQFWLLEFLSTPSLFKEELVGWTGSKNTLPQAQLKFKTKGEAVSYAKVSQIELVIEEPKSFTFKRKSYSDNFRFDRVS